MELTVLGCSGSYPTARAQCSGYLVQQDGFSLWMDAGNGTMGELQQHIGLQDVGAVVLSHAHPDHCADMYPFFYSVLFEGEPRDVYAPPGVMEKLDSLIGDDSKEQFRQRLRWHALSPGDRQEIGPFVVDVFDSKHSSRNNTMRIAAGGRTLCYSGDTGPNTALAEAAAEADAFICEASWLDEQKGIMGPIHMTAGETGEAAARADCGRLIVTHVWPSNDLSRIREQAAAHFDGPIDLAVDLKTVTV